MKRFTRICISIFIIFLAIHVTGTFISDRRRANQNDAFIENTASSTDATPSDSEITTEAATTTEDTEEEETIVVYIPSTETTETTEDTETSETTEEEKTTEEKKTTEAVTEAFNQTTMQMETPTKTNEKEKYIFVGDSRFVQMKSYAESDDTFIAENGVGYRFLSNHMDEIVSMSDADTKIVIGLGVNDVLSGTRKYKDLLFELAGKTDAQVYYMLINPVDDELCANNGYSVTNEIIDDFNITIQGELVGSGIKIIDANSYLKVIGYTSRDGLHYNAATSQNIYYYVKSQMMQN